MEIIPDIVIVGTRKDLDYMVCCADAGTIQDLATPSGGTSTDTESIDAAIIRPPLNPNLAVTTGEEGADGTLGTEDDVLMESTKITVVFGTGPAPSEIAGPSTFTCRFGRTRPPTIPGWNASPRLPTSTSTKRRLLSCRGPSAQPT